MRPARTPLRAEPAGQARDDHVDDGDDSVEDGAEDGADGVDDGYQAGADGVEHSLDLGFRLVVDLVGWDGTGRTQETTAPILGGWMDMVFGGTGRSTVLCLFGSIERISRIEPVDLRRRLNTERQK